MLKAQHPDGSEYLATNVQHFNFDVKDPHDINWRCPIDGCALAFVDSKKRTKHFRHLDDYAHQSVSESPKHHYLKHKLHDYWHGKNYTKNVTVEAQIGGQIADLLLVMQSGETIVVEVQLSLQDTQTFKERTRHYNNRNFSVLWLIGQGKYIKPKSVVDISEPTVSFKDPIKWLQKQYFGRFYSVVATDSNIEIIPTRFEHATALKSKWHCTECGKPTGEEYCHRCGSNSTYEDKYKHYYDSVATFLDGDLPDKKPFIPDKKGQMDYEEFEIARFYDSKWWD